MSILASQEQRFIHLSSKCELLRLLEHELDGPELQKHLQAINDPLTPYGSDPVFVKQSSLYRPKLMVRPWILIHLSVDGLSAGCSGTG